ncbi:GT4 family glycosyltransferase PelF [Corynebacterium aquilae]|uniref:GT4 family glycosyltransferase PelF n=1 Tax=Corynebacterium aquilae TaxID=203263 RepID=UPI00095254D3|nr:GT4 family glycosyltransferase PelF [Corynebacterium aquilae]
MVATETLSAKCVPAPGARAYTRLPGDNTPLVAVDVAIVMESTYPFLKGGVSAVVHDIVTHNPELSFGIIHIAWDSSAPSEDLYDMPANVRWVDVTYLSLEENRQAFSAAVLEPPAGMDVVSAAELAEALAACGEERVEPLWEIYRTAANPLTATRTVWPVLGTEEFMQLALQIVGDDREVTVGELFWAVRDLFSLAFSLCSRVYPTASVYHAHTTGYASFVAAAAAEQNQGSFLLTEHNLYVRDTVNTLIDRRMDLPVTLNSPEELSRTAIEKLWIRWWTDMGAFLYPSADHITYLYPAAIEEAKALGGDPTKSEVLPNGMVWEDFEFGRARRESANKDIAAGKHSTWRFACIARVVPIKGIMELIDTAQELVKRGYNNFTIDVLGPTEHVPDYYDKCVAHVRELGLEEVVFLRGTVKVREVLHEYDALVLASFNEGQPVVVLESMACGLPVVGTDVGGMDQVVRDPLEDTDGTVVDSCGVLVEPGDITGLADGMARLMDSPETYMQWHANALTRLKSTFLMPTIMRRYDGIYRRLGAGTQLSGGAPTPPGTADLGRGASDITDKAPQAAAAAAGKDRVGDDARKVASSRRGPFAALVGAPNPHSVVKKLFGGGYFPGAARGV